MSRIEKITAQNVSQLNFSSVTGYMVAEYDEHWWIGCVLESNPEKREVTMNFLHPHGPRQFFSFSIYVYIYILYLDLCHQPGSKVKQPINFFLLTTFLYRYKVVRL